MECGDTSPLLDGATRRAKQSADVSAHSIWPHAPAHWLFEPGIYMVTAGTYGKRPHWNTPERLDYFLDALFSRAAEFGWQLQAWSVLSNHYHFIATSPSDPGTLRRFLGKLHMTTAKQLNEWDATAGRKVWFQYWDSRITFERSYLARLHYVHHNPAHHGVVEQAESYPWCSASWFARNASPAFVSTVKSFKTDKLEMKDDF
jgi:putative transposase